MSTLLPILNLVLDNLHPNLAGPQVVKRLRHVASNLPPIPWAGFECHLGEHDTQVDFHQGIRGKHKNPILLLAYLDTLRLQAGISLPPAWQCLRVFCLRWSDPAASLGANIDYIVLEFDINTQKINNQAPSLFVSLRRDMTPSERYEVARVVLEILWGGAPTMQDRLACCFNSCPEGARIGHIGLMLSRNIDVVRVNINMLNLDQLASYLNTIGWNHPMDDLENLTAELIRFVDRITICLDIGTTIYPRIGLECVIDRQPPMEPRWEVFLKMLAKRGLCTPEKVDALLKWPGLTTPTNSTECWPGHLLTASLLQPPDQFSTFDRHLSHIKIDYKPQNTLAAKAYLGFEHRWFQDDKGVGKETSPSRIINKANNMEPRIKASNSFEANELDHAILKAAAYLLKNRDQGGWWRDFDDIGASDEWVTAYVGCALAAIPEKEAQHAAVRAWNLLDNCRKLSAGWGYNNYKPPDADSTAWSIRLATAVGSGGSDNVQSAIEFLKQHLRPNGGVATYNEEGVLEQVSDPSLLSSTDGWCQVHTCVTAAAAAIDQISLKLLEFLRQAQKEDGSWNGYWWYDDEYTTALSTEALVQGGKTGDHHFIRKAIDWAFRRVRPSGSVKSNCHDGDSVFAAAWVARILALAHDQKYIRERLKRCVQWLIGQQSPDGSWAPSAWLRVPPAGVNLPAEYPDNRSAIDRQGNFTTATALVALQQARPGFKSPGS